MIEIDIISILIGATVGFLSKLSYDELRTPKLRIAEITGPFLIAEKIEREIAVESSTGRAEKTLKMYHAYRVRVYNKQKIVFNAAARSCIAWMKPDISQESYQLCWIGGNSSLTINVGDYREVDLCAREVDTGIIIAPTEAGYFQQGYRVIGDGKRQLKVFLRITSENAKKEQKTIIIIPENNDRLNVRLELDP